MQNTTYDFIAVGVGPFNLGLACLTQPIKDLNGLFFDKNEISLFSRRKKNEETTEVKLLAAKNVLRPQVGI